MCNERESQDMGRNQAPSLLQHKGGRYYGRFSLGGKTKFVPLSSSFRARIQWHRGAVETEEVNRAVEFSRCADAAEKITNDRGGGPVWIVGTTGLITR